MRLRTFAVLVALAFVFTAYGQAASQAPQGQAPPQQAPAQAVATAQGELLEVDSKASTFAIKTAAAEISPIFAGRTAMPRIRRHPRVAVTTSATRTQDQTMRCARISTGVAGRSSFQYSGKSPQVR